MNRYHRDEISSEKTVQEVASEVCRSHPLFIKFLIAAIVDYIYSLGER